MPDPYAKIANRSTATADPYAGIAQRNQAPAPTPSRPKAAPDRSAGEGTYLMRDPWSGDTEPVRYSKVGESQNQGFTFANKGDRARWKKDYLADAAKMPWYSQERFDKEAQTFPDDGPAQRITTKATSAIAYPFFHPLDTLKGMADIASRGNPQGLRDAWEHPKDNPIGQRLDQARQESKQFGPGYAFSNLASEGVGSYAGGKLIEPVISTGSAGAERALPWAAEKLQSSGIDRMNTFLNRGEKLPLNERGELAWQTNPGKAVLEEGPGVSMAASRRGMIPKIAQAKRTVGRSIAPLAMESTAEVGTAPMWESVNRVVDPMIEDAMGPGGDQELAEKLETLRESFTPRFRGANSLPVVDVLGLKRLLDRNINRKGGFAAGGVNPIREAAKDIRAGLKENLYDAEPALREPSERYEALADASNRLVKSQRAPQSGPLTARNAGRLLSHGARSAAVGAGAGYLTHNPLLGAGVGVATEVAPRIWKTPAVQTGLATGQYQLGRGLNIAAPRLLSNLPQLGPSLAPLLPIVKPTSDDDRSRRNGNTSGKR